MRMVESTPASVAVDLQFLKPFKAKNLTSFTLASAGDAPGAATDVTWTMTGTRSAIMGVMGNLFFDKAIGADFERGLAALKQKAEDPDPAA